MGQPELASGETWGSVKQRIAESEAVDRTVEAWTRRHTLDEALGLARAGQVPCGPLNTIEDIFADPQFEARQVLSTVDVPGVGPVVVPAPLPRLSETPGRVEHLGPRLGADNTAVWCDLVGLGREELDALSEQGVV